MNDSIKAMLNDMAVYEDFNKEPFKAKAYRKAIQTIAGLDYEIDRAEQVKGLPGIGTAIFGKIDEFLRTGTFKRLEEFKASDASKIKEMAEIKGIGMAKAKKLYENGITSLEQLKKVTASLKAGDKINGSNEDITFTNAMKIGLDYEAHTDKTRMSISEHDSIVYPMVQAIEKMPGVKDVSAAGSARRYDGSDGYTVGDVDLIIGITGSEASNELRSDLEGLLDDITMSGLKKISGIKNRRQVDIKIVNEKDYDALLLHATGPMSFNIYCRNAAIKKGWKLNEYGLFSETGECLSKDEAEILDLLGIGWVEPKDRKNVH